MSFTEQKRAEIEKYILRKIAVDDEKLIEKTMDSFGVSITSAKRYLKKMADEGNVMKQEDQACGYAGGFDPSALRPSPRCPPFSTHRPRRTAEKRPSEIHTTPHRACRPSVHHKLPQNQNMLPSSCPSCYPFSNLFMPLCHFPVFQYFQRGIHSHRIDVHHRRTIPFRPSLCLPVKPLFSTV